ncbi:MAG: Bacterial CdiA-CT RNAse domain [Frankiales bacterium]|nr:Bacterial CdiA-CT RNAse domain [Frankiales bacterium]
MTTAVALARPDDLYRAAALLGGSADQLGTAVADCRRSAQVDWVGGPAENYQERLAHLADGLTRMRTAFEDACDALLAYARTVGAVQPLAEEADRLVLSGSEELLTRAELLHAEARDAEAVAAMRLCIVLEDLISRAPHVRAFALQHGLAHFAQGMSAAVSGLGTVISTAVSSLPGVGSDKERDDARDQLGDIALDAVQPWKQVTDLYDAINDGHGWFMAGELVPAWFLRTRLTGHRARALFLDPDAVPATVMLALDRGARGLTKDAVVDWYLAQHLRKELVAALARLSKEPLPSLDHLLRHGVDLVHQEAHDGHVLQRHIGRDADFLRARQDWDTYDYGKVRVKSSFSTLDEAESLVGEAIRNNERAIRDFLMDGKPSLEVRSPIATAGGLVMDARHELIPAREVVVILDRVGDTLHIRTAYLDG